MNEKTIPEFHQVEPRLSLAHFPPVEATINRNRIKMWEKNVAETGNAFCHTIG